MPAFFLPSPAFAGWPFWVASPCPLAGTRRGATVGLFRVSSSAKSGSGGYCYTPQNLTRTDLLRRSAKATLDGRSRSTPSLSLPAAARPGPSDPDRPPVDAGALLQSQIDELVVLQARFARLDRAWLPYLLGNAGPDRPRLTGSLLLAPTLVDFQQRLRALARRCGYLAQRTQRPLDRTQRAASGPVAAGPIPSEGARRWPPLTRMGKTSRTAPRSRPRKTAASCYGGYKTPSAIPTATGGRIQPRILAKTRSSRGRMRPSSVASAAIGRHRRVRSRRPTFTALSTAERTPTVGGATRKRAYRRTA